MTIATCTDRVTLIEQLDEDNLMVESPIIINVYNGSIELSKRGNSALILIENVNEVIRAMRAASKVELK